MCNLKDKVICNEIGQPIDLLTLRKTIERKAFMYTHIVISISEEYVKKYNSYMAKKLLSIFNT